MYRISELARRVGLSRSTLLYYEKLGLIASQRQSNGYRIYADKDLQQLRLLLQLQAGGLSLKECLACLSRRLDREALLERLRRLDEEIASKQHARALLAALLGQSSMRDWHQAMDQQAPGAHLAWLRQQGFSEKQALRLKWLSRDMNQHDHYMSEFEQIYAGLLRLGPGSDEDTLRAWRALPRQPGTILEIGCGRGASTAVLAAQGRAQITALDNDEHNLQLLRNALGDLVRQGRIRPVCASMTELPFARPEFDAIWAEGCAYIMGFSQALKAWRPHIRGGGHLVISDLVWATQSPPEQALSFWQRHYPDMQSAQARSQGIAGAGYHLLDSFPLSPQAWEHYLDPLESRVEAMAAQGLSSSALADLRAELAIHRQHLHAYNYQVFVLEKHPD